MDFFPTGVFSKTLVGPRKYAILLGDMRPANGKALCVIVGLAAAGCQGFVPPSPELASRVRDLPAPPGPYLRARVRIDIESSSLSGQFDGAILAQTGPRPRVRLQAFPDLGGKVLDLVASPVRIAGYLPQSNEGGDYALPLQGSANAFVCLGLSLLEQFAPLGEERLLGMKEGPDGWWILVRPLTDDVELTAFIESGGALARRRYRWSWIVQWDHVAEGRDAFEIGAHGTRIRIQMLDPRVVERVPDSAFELKVPADARPLAR